MSYIPQRPCQFADRLVVDAVLTRAADDGSEWFRLFVVWKIRKIECTS